MNTQGVVIPKEDGLLLASQKNPWAEASKWAERLAVNPDRRQVILGLGAGVHVLELARRTEQKIFVIDERQWLLKDFLDLLKLETEAESLLTRIVICGAEEAFSILKTERYQVHSFQPAWGPRLEEFLKLRDFLNARDLASASQMTSIQGHTGSNLVNLKQIQTQSAELQILKEMIK